MPNDPQSASPCADPSLPTLARLTADALGAERALLLLADPTDPEAIRLVADGGVTARLPRARSPLAAALLRASRPHFVPDLAASPYAADPLRGALPGARFLGGIGFDLPGGGQGAVAALDRAPRGSVGDDARVALRSARSLARRLAASTPASEAATRRDAERHRVRDAAALAALGSSADLPEALARGFERLLALAGADLGVHLTIDGERVRVGHVAGLPPGPAEKLLASAPPLGAAELTAALAGGNGRMPPLLLPVPDLEELVVVPVDAPRRPGRFEGALLLGARRGSAGLDADAPVLARAFAQQLEAVLLRGDLERELERTRETTLHTFGRLLERRRREDAGHTERVVQRARDFAAALGLGAARTRDLVWGAYLHDIGKLALPGEILDRPRPLTTWERTLVVDHAETGYDMSGAIPFLSAGARAVVRHHHERWDGGGYPARLQGDAIPLAARMFALIDVHDALVNDRPYRAAWSASETAAWLRAQGGLAFDPLLTEVFLEQVATPG